MIFELFMILITVLSSYTAYLVYEKHKEKWNNYVNRIRFPRPRKFRVYGT